MKLIDEIPNKYLELLGQAVVEGDQRAIQSIASDPSFKVGIGIDYRSRYHNMLVQESIQRLIKLNKDSGISEETVLHQKGHSFRIRIGRFIIYTKRLRYKYDEKPDPQYLQAAAQYNPSRQGDLFDPVVDPNVLIVAHLIFGKDQGELFTRLSIPDSSGGVLESRSLLSEKIISRNIPSELPLEMAPSPSIEIKDNLRSRVSGV